MLLWNIETDKRCIVVEFYQILAFLNLQQLEKTDHSINSFLIPLESHKQTGHTHFWPCPLKDIFINFILCEFVSTCKKSKKNSQICSGDIVDFKILQFDWLRIFWPISQEQKFSQIWFLCKNTANNISFHYRVNSVKINQQIFQ